MKIKSTLCFVIFGLTLFAKPVFSALEGDGSGLVGWWKFDDGSGSVATDSSGKGHNGTLINNPTWVGGRVGSGALLFDGASTYVDIPSSTDFDFPNEYSISAWVYSTNPDVRVSAVSRSMGNLWHFWTLEQVNLTGGAARFDMEYVTRVTTGTSSNRATGSGLGYSVNAWHHVVGVKTPGASKVINIYIDGKIGTNTGVITNPDPDLSGLDVSIGSRRSLTPDSVWFGMIDEVRIYNRALSASEIDDLYRGVADTSDSAPPTTPTSLSAAAVSSTRINLSWSASTDNVAVAGYWVYRGGVVIATVTSGTSYVNTGLTPGTTYSYTVSAFDAARNFSGPSTAASATTWDAGSAPVSLTETKFTTFKNIFNPMKETAMAISYQAPADAAVQLIIYDRTGDEVKVLDGGVGNASVAWDGKNKSGERVSAGVYTLVLKADGKTATKKVVIVK